MNTNWTSIDSMLPAIDPAQDYGDSSRSVKVFVWCKSYGLQIATLLRTDGHCNQWEADNSDGWLLPRVSHWQPMITGPNEQQESQQ